jgi:hypothetical protein
VVTSGGNGGTGGAGYDASNAASGTPPPARWLHGLTLANGMLYVHGGSDANGDVLSDLHAFDPIAVAWTDLSDGAISPPTARRSHGFTSAGKRLFVHNGLGDSGTLWDRFDAAYV